MSSLTRGYTDELDSVIKSIPGLRTSDSSYMNTMKNNTGKTVNYFIKVRDHRILFPIGRCLDRRYGNQPWTMEVDIGDVKDYMVTYHLYSNNIDERALEDSKILAEMLQTLLNNESTMKHFDLDKLFEEMSILDRDEKLKDLLDE